MKKCPTPVLLGADLNCYSMARAFFEAYGVPSYAFGRERLGATSASRYVRFTQVPQLGDFRVCLQTLATFASHHRGEAPFLLLPTTDEYAYLLIDGQEALSRQFLLSVPNRRFLSFFDKEHFYGICRRYGIPYPKTISLASAPDLRGAEELGERLGYPFIIKPSSSRSYWKHTFPGMEKVYLVHNRHAAHCVLESIFGAGYPDRVLAQQYLPGGDTAASVLTLYLDRSSRVILRAAGRVLLEEHTPCGKGNYAALMTERVPPIARRLAELLEKEGYRGFANFDLREDVRTGRTYVLEMNLRQGRSAHFLTAGGENPAVYLTEDVFLQKTRACRDLQKKVLFRTVPRSVLRRYVQDDALLAQAEMLFHTPRDENPFFDAGDLTASPRRLSYVLAHMLREKQKFGRYLAPVR